MANLIVSGDTSGSITLSAPAVSGSSVLTLPVTTDTLVGKATTDTLTNKTLTTPVLSGSVTGTYTLAGTGTLSSPIISGTPTGVGVLTSGTAVASTSGTSIDFTGIPSWVKRITVMFNGVSTVSTSKLIVRIGTGGSPTTSGYIAQASIVYSAVATAPETTGFPVFYDTAAFNISGSMVIQNISGNNWVMSAVGSNTGGTAFNWFAGGNVTLSGALNMIRLTTVNGTDTFDAGSINILYE